MYIVQIGSFFLSKIILAIGFIVFLIFSLYPICTSIDGAIVLPFITLYYPGPTPMGYSRWSVGTLKGNHYSRPEHRNHSVPGWVGEVEGGMVEGRGEHSFKIAGP